jgi:hypothetical protein
MDIYYSLPQFSSDSLVPPNEPNELPKINLHIIKEQIRALLGDDVSLAEESGGIRIITPNSLSASTVSQLDVLMADKNIGVFPGEIIHSFEWPVDPLKICDGIEALIGKRPFYNYEGIKIRLLYFEKLTEEESKVVLNYLKGLWYDNRTGN